MKDIESKQGVLSHHVPSEQKEPNRPAQERHCGDNIGSHGNRPEGQLVPRQQVTRVAEEERQQKEHHTHDPVKLVRGFVAAALENVKHVPED